MKVRSGLRLISTGLFFLLISCQVTVFSDDNKRCDDGKIQKKESVILSLATSPSQLITTQKTFSVEVGGKESFGYEPRLRGDIQAMIQSEKKGIQYAEKDAQLRIYVSLNTAEYNQKAKASKVERIWKYTGIGTSSKTAMFRGNGLVRVEDWTTGSPVQLYQELLTWNDTQVYDQEFFTPYTGVLGGQETAPSHDELKEAYIEYVTEKLRRELARGAIKYTVFLGDVKDHSLAGGIATAMAGNWQEAFDKWNAIPAFPANKAESYRLYNLGVACEALGLQLLEVEKLDEAEAKISQALKYYIQAREKNPTEDYFISEGKSGVSMIDRISRIQKECTEWKEYKTAKAAMAELAPIEEPTPKPLPQPEIQPSNDGIMRNVDVLVLLKEQLPIGLVKSQIEKSERTSFDLSTPEIIKLVKAGVPEEVIELMRANNNKPKPVPVPEPPKRKKKSRSG